MAIINIVEHYNELLKNGFKKGVNSRDMNIIARELYQNGKSKDEIREYIIKFCRKWNKQFNYAKWESKINTVINNLDIPYENKIANTICFTLNELEQIEDLPTFDLQKIMFIMLCLAKIYRTDYIYLNSKSKVTLREIYELAKVNKPLGQQDLVLYEFVQQGAINIKLKPLLKCYLLFLDTDKEKRKRIEFKPNSEMILEYYRYLGTKVVQCEMCGKSIIKTNNKVKYCKECARKAKSQKTVKARKNKQS